MTDRVRGSFGLFSGSAPLEIAFVTARFTTHQLKLLRTAREILPRADMTLKELMQRDIDDDRVRDEIVEYLRPLAGQERVRFFPPLVAAVVARAPNDEDRTLSDLFPEPQTVDGEFPRVLSAEDEVYYEERTFRNAFSVRIPLIEKDESIEDTELAHGAELAWNRDQVELLVLDGQHRLVALQAALGLLPPEERARGYRDSELSPDEKRTLALHHIPVCIVFPVGMWSGRAGIGEHTLISIYRQIFVDVNKQAKQVSESRNILLNERDLIAVFTRLVLDQFLTEGKLPLQTVLDDAIPLYAFEWDPPERKDFQITDPRAVSSVGVLYNVVESILLDGPAPEDSFRTELGIEEGDAALDPDQAEMEGPGAVDISPTNFAPWQRRELERRWNERWAGAITHLLATAFPFRQVIAAQERVRIAAVAERSADPLDEVPHATLDYLMGTRADRRQVERVASSTESRVGTLSAPACRTAVKTVREDLLQREVAKIREAPLGRLLFSNVGQTELWKFLKAEVYKNIDDAAPKEVVDCFTRDLNQVFSDHSAAEILFDKSKEWNKPSIDRLGTQTWRRDQCYGLFCVTLACFPPDGAMARLFEDSEIWSDVRRHRYERGIERIRASLKSRLPYQVRYEEAILAITDEAKRRKRIDERAAEEAAAILRTLHQFVLDNLAEEGVLPKRLE